MTIVRVDIFMCFHVISIQHNMVFLTSEKDIARSGAITNYRTTNKKFKA